MAVPADMTIDNLRGQFTLNKTLSSDMEPGLVIRKVGWAMRKAIKMMPSVTLKLIMEDSNLTIAIPGIGPWKPETQVSNLDWEWRDRKNPLGQFKTRGRLVPWMGLDDEWLKQDWEDENVVESEECADGWETTNVYGIQTVEGQRMWVMKASVKSTSKQGEPSNSATVYDYAPIAA